MLSLCLILTLQAFCQGNIFESTSDAKKCERSGNATGFEEELKIADKFEELAQIKIKEKDWNIAEKYLLKSKEIKEKIFNEYDINLIKTFSDLGKFYLIIKNYNVSENYLIRSLLIKELYYEQLDITLASTLCDLGSLYRATGKFEISERYLKKALDIYEVNQVSDAGLAEIIINLGDLFVDVENIEYLKKYFFKCFEIQDVDEDVYESIFNKSLSWLKFMYQNEAIDNCIYFRFIKFYEIFIEKQDESLYNISKEIRSIYFKLHIDEDFLEDFRDRAEIFELNLKNVSNESYEVYIWVYFVVNDQGLKDKADEFLDEKLEFKKISYNKLFYDDVMRFLNNLIEYYKIQN